jgi:hypothetical protein
VVKDFVKENVSLSLLDFFLTLSSHLTLIEIPVSLLFCILSVITESSILLHDLLFSTWPVMLFISGHLLWWYACDNTIYPFLFDPSIMLGRRLWLLWEPNSSSSSVFYGWSISESRECHYASSWVILHSLTTSSVRSHRHFTRNTNRINADTEVAPDDSLLSHSYRYSISCIVSPAEKGHESRFES